MTISASVPSSRAGIIQLIESVAGSPRAFEQLEHSRQNISKDELGRELLVCGIIPEKFAHDSSEEKLWAKHCDIVLAQTFRYLNIPAEVLRARGDAADVFAKTAEYSLVADAKAFRLSRTAKIQKDFKVGALDDWRRADTYACLVAPLYQYPTSRSQIYRQAEERNVTLLSYVRLRFLLDFTPAMSLAALWALPRSLSPSPDAAAYWSAIEHVILNLTGQSTEVLVDYKHEELRQTRLIGQESIAFWESVTSTYRTLSREDAIETLIKHAKIDSKIQAIKRAIAESRAV